MHFDLVVPAQGDDTQENRDAVMNESSPNNRTHVYWELPYSRPILWMFLKQNIEIGVSDECGYGFSDN